MEKVEQIKQIILDHILNAYGVTFEQLKNSPCAKGNRALAKHCYRYNLKKYLHLTLIKVGFESSENGCHHSTVLHSIHWWSIYMETKQSKADKVQAIIDLSINKMFNR